VFEFPAAHCPAIQIESVASVSVARAAVDLLLGARYVIALSDGGELMVLRVDDLALWWDEPAPSRGSCVSA
jgi:hypothetical protein